MKLISCRIFQFVRKDGMMGTIELYLNESGTFGYRMFNSFGHENIRKNFDDGTEAQKWYEHTIKLFEKKMKEKDTNLKSWKEIK